MLQNEETESKLPLERAQLLEQNHSLKQTTLVDPNSRKDQKQEAKFLQKIFDLSGQVKKKQLDSILQEASNMSYSAPCIEKVVQTVIQHDITPQNAMFYMKLLTKLNSEQTRMDNLLMKNILQHARNINSRQVAGITNEEQRSKKRKNLIKFLFEAVLCGLITKNYSILEEIKFEDETQNKTEKRDFTDLLIILLREKTDQIQDEVVALTLNLVVPCEIADNYAFCFEPISKNGLFDPKQVNEIFNQIKKIIESIREIINSLQNQIQDMSEKSKQLKDQKLQLIKYGKKLKAFIKEDIDQLDEFYESESKPIEISPEAFEYEQDRVLYLNLPQQIQKQQTQQTALSVDEVKQKFNDCTSVELADQLSTFLLGPNKKDRNMICEEYLKYNKNYQWVVPYQTRVLAILNEQSKEIEETITKRVMEQFRNLKSGEQYHRDKSLRIVRMVSELTKFQITRPDIILDIFSNLINDLAGELNFELIILITETCGKFLYHSINTHKKFSYLIEQMNQQRIRKPLTQQQDFALIDARNQILGTNVGKAKPKRQKSKFEQWVEWNLYQGFDCRDFDEILMNFKQLQWQGNENLIVKKLIKAITKCKFAHLPKLSSLISNIADYYPIVVMQVVDNLFEEIQQQLEDNNPFTRQRRVQVLKVIGELYAYKLINNETIFKLMNTILNHGHDNKEQSDVIDPPNDSFRITMIMSLLEQISEFFQKKTKNKLLKFIIYFQRYLLSKEYIPQLVEFQLLDVYDTIDPNLKYLNQKSQIEYIIKLSEDCDKRNTVLNIEEEIKGLVQNQPKKEPQLLVAQGNLIKIKKNEQPIQQPVLQSPQKVPTIEEDIIKKEQKDLKEKETLIADEFDKELQLLIQGENNKLNKQPQPAKLKEKTAPTFKVATKTGQTILQRDNRKDQRQKDLQQLQGLLGFRRD